MADELPPPDDDALHHAHAEFDAMQASASSVDAVADTLSGSTTIHEVEGVGRYAVPYRGGWAALLATLTDPEARLGFSRGAYPAFDAVLATRAERPSMAEPTQAALRLNLAAVRNFLMQVYYTETPDGLTAEQAVQSLRDIAVFVGEGLRNNPRLVGLLSHHDPHMAFIDIHLAARPDGAGAQYIYEKILEMDRQSHWMRPFSAIVALLGGTIGQGWHLPQADATPFFAGLPAELFDATPGSVEEVDALLSQLDTIEEQHRALQDSIAASATVTDLEAMGNQLIYTAESLRDVRQMSEPVRQDAIEIAKDILRKLKLGIGEVKLLDGLGLKPRDELNELGGIKAVALVYERLLGWARGIDPSIMQHPSIHAATQALGQLGFVAKREAWRVARLANQITHAKQLEQQLNFVPGAYSKPDDTHIAPLLEKVERGIDTVLNRIVTITGPAAAVGHTPNKELGSYMAGTPIAGMAMQGNAEGVGGRDAAVKQQLAIQEGIQTAQRAQVQRVAQQVAQQARTQAQQHQQPQASGRAGNLQAQLAAMRQRLAQARRQAQLQQQQMQGVRNANRLATQQAHHHADHVHGQPPSQMAAAMAKLDPRLINNIKQMNSTTAGLTTNPVLTGRAAFEKMQQATTYGMKPGSKKPMTEEEIRRQQALNTPPPPKKDGRSI